MKLPRRKFLQLAAGAVGLPAMGRVARAQAYPTQPVRIIAAIAVPGLLRARTAGNESSAIASLRIINTSQYDPDTLANLGPLRPMAGTWEGVAGTDVHPVVDGSETDVFVERYELQPIDPQTNGPQLFYGLRYHQHIVKPGEVEMFHEQVGFLLWEPATGTILMTLAIPRGQVPAEIWKQAEDLLAEHFQRVEHCLVALPGATLKTSGPLDDVSAGPSTESYESIGCETNVTLTFG